MDRTRHPSKLAARASRGLIPVLIALMAGACSGPGAESGDSGIGLHFNMQDVLALRQALAASGANNATREQGEVDGWAFRASVTGPGIDTAITSERIFTFQEADVLGYDTYLTVPGVPDGSGRILDVKVLELIAGEDDFQFIQGIATGINVSGGSATINYPFSSPFCVPPIEVLESGFSSSLSTEYDLGRSAGVSIFGAFISAPGSIKLIYEGNTIFDTSNPDFTASASWISYVGSSSSMTVTVTNPNSDFWDYQLVCRL